MALVPFKPALGSGSFESTLFPIDEGGFGNAVSVDVTITPNVEISAGNTYAIVLYCSDGTYVDEDTNNCPAFLQKLEGDYAGGSRVYSTSGDDGTWTSTARDLTFGIIASSVVKDEYTDNDSLVYLYDQYYHAQTFTASQSYTLDAVRLTGVRSDDATDPGPVDVYIYESGEPASKAINPTPANGATEVDWSTPTLSWDGNGDTYTVYVADSGGGFIASDIVVEDTASTSYTLSSEQKDKFEGVDGLIYWRVDSTSAGETITGDTWSFDPRPGAATGPTPEASATDIGLSQQLAWSLGAATESISVYITHEWTLEVTKLIDHGTVVNYDWDFDYLEHSREHYWWVVSHNFFGDTESTHWKFDTSEFDHIRVTYNLIDDGSGNGPYDDPPGIEGVDFSWTGLNNVMTMKRLIVIAKDRLYFEEL